jgi:hypothetical protein
MQTEENGPGNTVDELSNQTLKEAPMRPEVNQNFLTGEDQGEVTRPMETEENIPEIILDVLSNKGMKCNQTSETPIDKSESDRATTNALGIGPIPTVGTPQM